MLVKLYNCSDDRRTLNKNLSHVVDTECIIKYDFDRNTPTLVLAGNYNANYAYADGKYYFLSNKIYETGHRVLYNMDIDVLMTYREDIKSSSAIRIRSNNNNVNRYIDDTTAFVTQNKSTTQIIEYDNGLNEDGEFILVTVGG